ncbi:restriction endonuclease subunit S [Thermococcus sp.]
MCSRASTRRGKQFKKTPIGEIPEDWDVKPLSEVAEYINGYAFSPKDWKDKGLPIIRIQNLNDPEAEFNYFEGEIDEKYIVKDGDLLFSWSASIGVYIWNRGKAVLNQHIFKVIPKKGIDKLYLYYAMFLAIKQLKNRIHGSTMKHFKKGELKRTFIPIPPLPEQKKIAEILRTVDDAIEKTDEAIERTERLKKGLMQRLLTKGIKHERFKKTEIGEIPEEWKVVRLGEVCTRRNEIIHPEGEGKYKFIGLEHIESGRIKISNYGSDKEVKSSKFKFYPGDILYGKLRPYLDKAVIADFEGICSTDLLVLTAKIDKTLPEFLIYVIHSKGFINYATATTSGTNHPRTSWKAISKYKFGLPLLSEQKTNR